VIERAEAHGGSLRVHGGHGDGGRVHYGARVVHPSAGASFRLDARCIFFAAGVSQGPWRLWRRRQVRTLSAWVVASVCECQHMADGPIGDRGGWGRMRDWGGGKGTIGDAP
jgi:hypothetical protein